MALAAALLVALMPPLIYTVDEYPNKSKDVALRAERAAQRVATFADANPLQWQHQVLNLSALLVPRSTPPIHRQLIDVHGQIIAEAGPDISPPRFYARTPVVLAGQRIGEVVATESMLPVLSHIGIVVLISVATGFLTYLAVRTLPIRAIDKALRRLRTQNIRFEAALDNMTQGLCMLDAQQRVAVLNSRFLAMFGIADRKALVDASPHDLMTAVLRAGTVTAGLGEKLFGFSDATDASNDSRLYELPDGRFLTASRQPIKGGGWVATYEDVTERRRAEDRIGHMALHDALTNLPNRTLLRIHLERELTRVSRGDQLAVLFLDLDRFKTVNDTLGHSIGDRLLKAVTERLMQNARESDVIARLGGDEFAIIQAKVEQPANARTLARRLVEIIGGSYLIDGYHIVVGVSIGIALAPADGLLADDILRNADLALYRAKADGRGTFRFFEPAMDAEVRERRRIELDLRQALENHELQVYYQPLIELASGRISAFEALLRWQHPMRGLVLPCEFVPVAEEVGLIGPLSEWVLNQACREATRWPASISLAINVSVAQFRSPGLVKAIADALQRSGLAPNRLEIEVTETLLMHETDAALATLARLRKLGVRISMDDFGTGYSSLSYLRSFPFDKIKIDQCFVRDLSTQQGSIAIIRAIANLGRALGMSVVVEGVETEKQLAQIKAEGCAEAQGFLFSPPRPPEAIPELLVRFNRPECVSAAQSCVAEHAERVV